MEAWRSPRSPPSHHRHRQSWMSPRLPPPGPDDTARTHIVITPSDAL